MVISVRHRPKDTLKYNEMSSSSLQVAFITRNHINEEGKQQFHEQHLPRKDIICF